MKKRFLIGLLLLWIGLSAAVSSRVQGQDVPSEQPPAASDEEKEKEKAEREKRAFTLLDQIADESQMLRLPENRIRVQIDTADLLWDHNQARARSLLTAAADGIAELMRNSQATDQRRGGNNPNRMNNQLRQSLVLTAARHDAQLAYQVLATTRSLSASTGNQSGSPEANLEQLLLLRIAAVDPQMALQNAEQLLEKGQYPRTLTGVLAELQKKDKEGAAKLEDKILKRLQSANMLASPDAGNLALGLLQAGPRPAENPAGAAPPPAANPSQLLAQSGYTDLMGAVIDAALKATPQATATQRGLTNLRRRGNGPSLDQNNSTPPTDAQIEQTNARRLLNSLQMMLPQIDQYAPSRAAAVRQKLTELGMADNQRAALSQVFSQMRQATSEALMSAAQSAPPQMQSRIYQQAALKALDEGDSDRARQIATDHLDANARDRVLQQVEFRQISEKADSNTMAELQQKLASLRSDDERIALLLQLSLSVRKNNTKLALQFLNEAKQLTNRKATGYLQFEQQLRLAEAFRDLEPARSFEVLEPGISQLNELLSAAAILSGFEMNLFKDGELPLESRNNLTNMVQRYGKELGALASSDFDRAQTLANRFQLTESRVLARLSIVRGMLSTDAAGNDNSQFGFRAFGPASVVRPPQ
jgi:hypothetical protein